jgi:hypothetical protein
MDNNRQFASVILQAAFSKLFSRLGRTIDLKLYTAWFWQSGVPMQKTLKSEDSRRFRDGGSYL